MLNAQANALNTIFGELCRRASLNMGQHMDTAERYLRLAFKGQGQCRATLETLAAIKNPPLVYAKQANIAHGPQQVNNGGPGFSDALTPVRAHEETGIEQSKLLAGEQHGSKFLNAGTATAGGNPALETWERSTGPTTVEGKQGFGVMAGRGARVQRCVRWRARSKNNERRCKRGVPRLLQKSQPVATCA